MSGMFGPNATPSPTITSNPQRSSFSVTIFDFIILMVVCFLILAQQETCFLITRSVSRKEFFAANSIFIVPIAMAMVGLEIFWVYVDGSIRSLFGQEFEGIKLDIQNMMAPNAGNIAVLFLVGFSIVFLQVQLVFWWVPFWHVGRCQPLGHDHIGFIVPGSCGRSRCGK